MHALDLRTRELLWSFSDNSAGPWHFGDALPADAALYVQTANKLLKLHAPP